MVGREVEEQLFYLRTELILELNASPVHAVREVLGVVVDY